MVAVGRFSPPLETGLQTVSRSSWQELDPLCGRCLLSSGRQL